MLKTQFPLHLVKTDDIPHVQRLSVVVSTKYLMLVVKPYRNPPNLHFISQFCGLLITFQASFTLAQNAPYLDFAGSKFKGPLIVLIIIGSCVCAFGVAGCIAAFKANHVLQFLVSF